MSNEKMDYKGWAMIVESRNGLWAVCARPLPRNPKKWWKDIATGYPSEAEAIEAAKRWLDQSYNRGAGLRIVAR